MKSDSPPGAPPLDPDSIAEAVAQPSTITPQPPQIPDHEMLRCIGQGSYGEVWLARNVMGEHRAVKVVHRATLGDNRPFEREFEGIKKFEPISRSHESQVQILHVGINAAEGYFYYVMELADDANSSLPVAADVRRLNSKSEIRNPKLVRASSRRLLQGRGYFVR